MEINLEHKVAMALERAGLPRKPAYTQPCNGCMLCCTLQLCHVAEQAFPGRKPPCPAILVEEHENALRGRCGLVVTEQMLGSDQIGKALGIGSGCSMPDDHTTDEEIAAFDRASFIKIYGKEPLGR